MASRLLPFAALAVSVSALSIPRDSASTPGVLSFPVFTETSATPLHKLKRRQVDTDVPVLNVSSTSYLIQLSIGTPGQTVRVAIDTGSSELWVNPNCDNAGSASQQNSCVRNGHYNPSTSSSAAALDQTGHVKYGKGEVLIQYVNDDIALPGSDVDLKQVNFGAATDSVDLNMGIMGLSFGEKFNLQYPNFVDELQIQNVTKTRAFGVALGDKTEKSNSGLISFGGVDTKKFSGKLHTSPILGPQNGESLYRYWVQLNSVGLTQGGNAKTYSGSAFPVFFDTGATLSYLPSAVVKNLVSDLGGRLDSQTNLYRVPCGKSGSFDFTFGDTTIRVPFEEFIWALDTDFCVLGADIADDGSYLLGDSFLRSTYTVFDIDTPALHFAPYQNCGTNLQVIPAGNNAAAQFSGECDAQKPASKPNSAGHNAPVSGVWYAAAALIAVQIGMTLL